MKFLNQNSKVILEVDDSTTRIEFPRLASDETCTNLVEGLRCLRNLHTLIYGVSRKQDPNELMFLAGLSQLREIAIGPLLYGQDISPLESCSSLETLRIISMTGVDVQPLSRVSSLRSLWLDGTGKNIGALSTLSDLRHLQVTHAKMVPLASLCTLAALEDLSLSGSTFRNIPLFPKLKALDVSYTNIASVEVIGNQSALKSLSLNGCGKLKSLDGIDQLSNLEELELDDIKLPMEIRPIGRLAKLAKLRIGRTGIINNELKPQDIPPSLVSVRTSRQNSVLIKAIAKHRPECRIEFVGSQGPRETIGHVDIYEDDSTMGKSYRIDQDLTCFLADTNDEAEDLVRNRLHEEQELDVTLDSEGSAFVATSNSLDDIRRVARVINLLINRSR